jgi:hypothetical protein
MFRGAGFQAGYARFHAGIFCSTGILACVGRAVARPNCAASGCTIRIRENLDKTHHIEEVSPGDAPAQRASVRRTAVLGSVSMYHAAEALLLSKALA